MNGRAIVVLVGALGIGVQEGVAQSTDAVGPVSFELSEMRGVVTGRVSGNFPGSPVDLRYVFTLEDGKIARLEIS